MEWRVYRPLCIVETLPESQLGTTERLTDQRGQLHLPPFLSFFSLFFCIKIFCINNDLLTSDLVQLPLHIVGHKPRLHGVAWIAQGLTRAVNQGQLIHRCAYMCDESFPAGTYILLISNLE